MNLSQSIANAALPDPHVVLGIRLKPFTIGHWLHGHRFNLSFLSEENHTLGDLLIGVLICSNSYAGFTELSQSPRLALAMRGWRFRLAGGVSGWWKRLYSKPTMQALVGFDFAEECIKFQTYLDEHGATPWRYNDWSLPCTKQARPGDGRPIASPVPMLILCALLAECHLSMAEALDLPLPFARWLIACQAERTGAVTVIDREEWAKEQEKADAYAREVYGWDH